MSGWSASGGSGWSGRWPRWLALAVVALAAGGVALAVVQPFTVGPVGFDSASSVAFFQRLAAGQRLEAYLGTTPKPLLTVVYGVLYGLFGDWRVISWATIGAFAVSVAFAARLAARVAGPAAAVFAAIGLVALPLLMSDLILAYATPWAMLGWFGAGLLVTAPRPRYGWAGVALLLATLARLETLALVGCLLVAIAAWWLGHRLAGRDAGRSVGGPAGPWFARLPAPPPRAWLLSVALLALPVMLVHDWLLTGDPFYWAHVSAAYSAAAPSSVETPLQLLSFVVRRYRRGLVEGALALVGGLYLLRRLLQGRRGAAAVAVGLFGLGPGVTAFLLVIAARGTYVSTRYFAAVDVAVVLTAAIGAGVLLGWAGAWVEARGGLGRHPRGRRTVLAASIVLAVVAAFAAQPQPAPLSATILDQGAAQRTLDRDADLALPAIRAALDRIPHARDGPPAGVDWDHGHAVPAVLLGPDLLRPRLAVDLHLPLSQVAGLSPRSVTPGPAFLGCADLVLHDRAGDDPVDGYALLEISAPVTLGGGITLTPLIAAPGAGYWLISVQRSGTAEMGCTTSGP